MGKLPVMGCVLQIGLFLLGAWLVSRVLVKVGGKELRSPHTTMAGLILACQLPISLGIGLALGGAEGVKATREGVDSVTAQERMRRQYWWLDVALPAAALTLAATVAVSGLREPIFEPSPPDDPVGITDHRTVMAQKWESDRLVRRTSAAAPAMHGIRGDDR